MRDPYQVLGVNASATDDEIKKAYRTLSKKYHPDANINNPNKDAYTEKFKEVQNAYDQIMDMRKRGTSYQSYQDYQNNGNTQYRTYSSFDDLFRDFAGGGFYQQTYGQEDAVYSTIRNYIRQGYMNEALSLLNQMNERTAQWFYYAAICHHKLGNNVTAMEYAEKAVQLEPNVMEYQQFLANLKTGRTHYRQTQAQYSSPMSAYGSFCLRLWLYNLICNCLCGGRIFWC